MDVPSDVDFYDIGYHIFDRKLPIVFQKYAQGLNFTINKRYLRTDGSDAVTYDVIFTEKNDKVIKSLSSEEDPVLIDLMKMIGKLPFKFRLYLEESRTGIFNRQGYYKCEPPKKCYGYRFSRYPVRFSSFLQNALSGLRENLEYTMYEAKIPYYINKVQTYKLRSSVKFENKIYRPDESTNIVSISFRRGKYGDLEKSMISNFVEDYIKKIGKNMQLFHLNVVARSHETYETSIRKRPSEEIREIFIGSDDDRLMFVIVASLKRPKRCKVETTESFPEMSLTFDR